MCAISGIICRNNLSSTEADAAKRELDQIVSSQQRRGPDGSGTWNDGRAFLGHNRLAIIDLSDAGKQPMESASWVITYNGEIFNFIDIRRQLESRGYHFKSHCDTEVLLYAIEEYGIDQAIQQLNGFFAICAYHKPTGTSYLIRDRLGIKPLFYYIDEEKFVFASMPGAIANNIKKHWQLDAEAVYRFFLLGAPYTNKTFFKGIYRLESATILKFDPNTGNISKHRYWNPKPRNESVGELLHNAITIRRVGDVPMVVFFSGGVDSSVIASVLRDVDAIHLDSPERSYAEKVASDLGLKLIVTSCHTYDHDAIHQDYARLTGEASMASPIPYIVGNTLSQHNYKVAFSANGADELFYGYPRTPIPGLNRQAFGEHNYDGFSFLCLRQQLKAIFRSPSHFNLPFAADTSISMEQLESEIREQYYLANYPESSSYRWLELRTYVEYDLNYTLDFATMAHGLEMRTPFLDYRLVERVLAEPPENIVTPRYGRKSPLKEILIQNKIDANCFQRPKLGFSLAPHTVDRLIDARTTAFQSLSNRNILQISDSCFKDGRSKEYLLGAAYAFENWCRVWIDTGIVYI